MSRTCDKTGWRNLNRPDTTLGGMTYDEAHAPSSLLKFAYGLSDFAV